MTTATATKPKATKKAPAKRPPLKAVPPPEIAVRFQGAQLRAALACAAIAASADEYRPILTGALLRRTDNGMEIITTDGYRIHRVEMDLETDARAAIPAGWSGLYKLDRTLMRWVLDICKTPGKVDCTFTSTAWTFTTPDRIVKLPTIEGQYPEADKFFTERRQLKSEKPVSFDPNYLADVGAAAKAIGAELRVDVANIEDSLKTGTFTAANHALDLRLTVVLMTVRTA